MLMVSGSKNTADGVQIGQAGTGYNLEIGPVMLTAGVKAAYIGGKKEITALRFLLAAV